MAFPPEISTATVLVGTALDFSGDSLSLTVEYTPVLGGNAKRIIWAATGQPLAKFKRTFTATNGPVTFVVPHVDQTGFVDGSGNAVTMWAYDVKVTISSGTNRVDYNQPFQPLVGQTNVDLDLVPDGSIAAPVSAPVPAVTSVNGQTGNVTITAGDTHTHETSQITGLAEHIRDVVGTALVAGTGVNVNVNDAGDTITISASGAPASHSHATSDITGFTEAVQDAIGALLVGASGVVLNYNDAANTLTISGGGSGGLDAEAVRDAIGVAIVGTAPIQVVVNDSADTITFALTGTIPLANMHTDVPIRKLYTGSAWPARPALANSVEWLDLTGEAPPTMPPGYVPATDTYYQVGMA